MWKDEIKKEIGYGGPKDVERKIQSLERMNEQMIHYKEIISSLEFQRGFPKDSVDDIVEASKLLDKVIELLRF